MPFQISARFSLILVQLVFLHGAFGIIYDSARRKTGNVYLSIVVNSQFALQFEIVFTSVVETILKI